MISVQHVFDRCGRSGGLNARTVLHAAVWTGRHLTGRLSVPALTVIEERFLQSNHVCLDIGAHGGSWSVGLAKFVRRGHVYSFEAFPYYATALSLALSFLRLNNATVVNAAVSDRPGSVTLVERDLKGKPLTGEIHLLGKNEAPFSTSNVPAITLDGYLASVNQARPISFMKIDIEGAEMLALRGARELVSEFRPVVYCELDSRYCQRYGYTVADTFELMTGSGYSPYVIVRDTLQKIGLSDYVDGGDVLFVPKGR